MNALFNKCPVCKKPATHILRKLIFPNTYRKSYMKYYKCNECGTPIRLPYGLPLILLPAILVPITSLEIKYLSDVAVYLFFMQFFLGLILILIITPYKKYKS
jgi:hypothetical protein